MPDFNTLFRDIYYPLRKNKPILFRHPMLLDGKPLDHDSLRCVGYGSSKRVISFGDGTRVFFITAPYIISDEMKVSEELTSLGLLTQQYQKATLSIQCSITKQFSEKVIMVADNFIGHKKLSVHDHKSMDWHESHWASPPPELYNGDIKNFHNPQWNQKLLQSLVNEYFTINAFDINIRGDRCHFAIERSSSKNEPPVLHYMLYDYAQSVPLAFPIASKTPNVVTGCEGLKDWIAVMVTQKEAKKLGFKDEEDMGNRIYQNITKDMIETAKKHVEDLIAARAGSKKKRKAPSVDIKAPSVVVFDYSKRTRLGKASELAASSVSATPARVLRRRKF